MKRPVVSILILTYNRLKMSKRYIPGILECLGDIETEVLIWDNCSTDGTYDWLEEYGRADCRITKVFGAHKNIGVEATNMLAKEARGKYIIKIDDDVGAPVNFAKRMVAAYEEANEKKLLFLGWDMGWGERTFAKRSGMKLYKGTRGKVVTLNTDERILISYEPMHWMVNGVCRFSPRKPFLKIGGHPKGIIYGVDYLVSKRAHRHGYWIGFFETKDLVNHFGGAEDKEYRNMKNAELAKHGAPLHV
jgi:glycosyltransferase involved in cell wall biosynthesis